MRVAALIAVLLASGCFGGSPAPPREVTPPDVGYDATLVNVSGFAITNVTIASFDGTILAVTIYVPRSNDIMPGGGEPKWPIVLFVHGWAGNKEDWQGNPPLPENTAVLGGTNRLKEYSLAGFISVAYDTRGFGASGGETTVAGLAEERDLGVVLNYTMERFRNNGRVAVVGGSYGGGHAYEAWARNPRVTTAVPHYGWVDLYQALLPGNVPKLEWGEFLYFYGLAGSQLSYSQMVHDWYVKATLRQDLETVNAQMAKRSIRDEMPGVNKPLFICQGLEETLFPQADIAWSQAGGFTRAYLYTGGHGSADAHCWDHTMAWLRFFLLGIDTRVDQWPALESVDMSGSGPIGYDSFPVPVARTYFLREPNMVASPTDTSFTVSQQLVANPIQEPQALWDAVGMPNTQVPTPLRQDPTAHTFTTPPAETSEVLLGSAVLHLRLSANVTAPYQIVGVLYVESGASSRLVSRGAAAVIDPNDQSQNLTMRFDWTKADIAAGDRITLKIGANDETAYIPLPANYAVTFSGASWVELPYFEG